MQKQLKLNVNWLWVMAGHTAIGNKEQVNIMIRLSREKTILDGGNNLKYV